MDRDFVFYYSDKYLCDLGSHPFNTYKYKLIVKYLLEWGVISEKNIEEPKLLSYEELNLVHTTDYLDEVLNYVVSPRTIASELPVRKDVIGAFRWNVSGSVRAAEFAYKTKGFSANIGGGFHHAFHHRAEGFCFFNDVALAAKILLDRYKAKKIAIIDCDLHQGNGTAFIMRTSSQVFTFSIHQEDIYPIKEKSSLDIGLYSGAGDDEYLPKLEEALDYIDRKFKPRFIIYVAGMDPYKKDLLGGLELSKEGLMKRDEMVISYARGRDIPMIVVLAGGYPPSIEELASLHANTLKILVDYYTS